MSKELSEINNLFKANQLCVNADKTNFLILGTSFSINKYFYVNVPHDSTL